MKAIVVSHPGGPEVLEYREVPTPTVKEGWTLMKVHGFGINHSEIFTRRGDSPSVHFPRILGIEAVGEVAETSAPSLFHQGQKIISIMGEMGRDFDGGYAEYALLPNTQIYPVTTNLSWEELAAVPETYQTAYGIVTALQLKKDDKVLIRAATSGVGQACLKLIKAIEPASFVTGTTRSDKKRHQLIDAGFDDALVANEVLPGDRKFDKIVELVGPATLRDSLKHVAPFGIVNMTGELGDKWTVDDFDPVYDVPNYAYLTGFQSGLTSTEELQEMIDLIEKNHIDVKPEKVFKLAETAKAHEYLEGQQSFGKVVVMNSEE
ncbi:zinc-binding dehydrogenase [Paucilactobacillus suebicus]|uniref:Oxidoreductase n=1 Tax=Paucilactobacillus suebicus DSM 5007 = KCTC 3549 TaxID=1423807 RepID=A0A0R1WCI1_9LACO|nr:zinc-binding dehydrogenase [Paucilactobacillus suebicus]KRM11900.1 oxidoreductase [Paucilactobacillus suebicus DSM 5007 = KCTC 3549]